MSEQAKQDSQKTIVAFVAGLLIGGLLVYVFALPADDEVTPEVNETDTEEVAENNDVTNDDVEVDLKDNDDEEVAEMETGDGDISVSNQAAGPVVKIDGATFPSDEGWIGVRDYANEQLGGILGVARFSNEQGLIPTQIELLRSTVANSEYALVFYSESGDRLFNLADDKQNGEVAATFTAN